MKRATTETRIHDDVTRHFIVSVGSEPSLHRPPNQPFYASGLRFLVYSSCQHGAVKENQSEIDIPVPYHTVPYHYERKATDTSLIRRIMAGLGRRTHYRKHLTDSVLHDLPEPNPPHSQIAKIVATRGSNQFDVKLANNNNNNNGQPELAILPTKFRKLVWLKRNDYVIVETVHDEDDNDHNEIETPAPNNDSGGGIRCMISHILYQDQIKHLIAKGIWPTDDPDFVVDDRKMMEAGGGHQPRAAEDGIVYDDAYIIRNDDVHTEGEDGLYVSEEEALSGDDPLLFVNTNRLARLTVQDSSSDEDEE